MILIADSGSTKTDWRIIDKNNEVQQAKTSGFNPNYQSSEVFYQEIKEMLIPKLKSAVVQSVFFYGSGCAAPKNKKHVTEALSKAFPKAHIEVNHDLLAVARALCNHEAGIVCVLGTGSSSCLYDGESVVDQVPSMGYLVGDEGSGVAFGRKLVGDYFKRQLPDHLSKKFEKRFNPDESEVLENLYQKPFPNRYLGGFAKFLFDNLNDPYVHKMVYGSFEEFLRRNVMVFDHFKDYPVHFVGSISFYYANVLRQVGADLQVNIKNIAEGPIAGLTLYHQED